MSRSTHLVVELQEQALGSLLEKARASLPGSTLHSLAERTLAPKVPSDTMQLPVTHHSWEPLRASAVTSRRLHSVSKKTLISKYRSQ